MISINTDNITQVLKTFPLVEAAYLFGSMAAGTASNRSDMDLALVVDEPLGNQKLDILAALTAKGIDNVDLVTLDKDDVVLKFEAVRLNKLIYAKEQFDHGSYYSRVIREYFDFMPILKEQRAAKKRELASG